MVTCLLDCFEFSERHTSENLAEELLKVAKEWNVENKVVCCVSDNAANITKAIKSLKWTHHPCLAHTLNLVVRDALKVMKPTVDKVKGIVEFFHRSTTATQKLKSTPQQMGMPELKLKQECITRWNSTFHMLKRILESKDAVISTLAVINAPIDPLSQEEWEILQEACTVQEPFEQVTVEISADSYVTGSKVLILCKGLQKVTAEHQTSVTTGKVKELVDALCASMDRKFHRMEWNTVLSETTILDPRFKKLAFTDNRAVDEALQRITAAAARASQTTPLPGGEEGEEGAEQQQEEPQACAVWRFFEERVTGSTTRRNPSSDAILEVRSYLEEPLFQRSADPLSWWEAKDSLYPRLTHVMTRRLCVVATSVPSERIFSKTGQMLTERRNRINPSKLRHLVFLNANLH
ncbi:zinc finger BED domain-containing protein 4-like [Hippocampus zosterae]|uniref:zinc finger BED domain-containing protein 4-like n=1 Tax=Hippocampus zosterae TaxID=109293 RepID=UPI00223D8324|nr:zinc finger BED domain-containing protein 4-like [Hippocampus zosterae]